MRAMRGLGQAFSTCGITNIVVGSACWRLVCDRGGASPVEGRRHPRCECCPGQLLLPIASVVGYDMPPEAASVFKQATDTMVARAEINHPWQALEFWAAEYLAGP